MTQKGVILINDIDPNATYSEHGYQVVLKSAVPSTGGYLDNGSYVRGTGAPNNNAEVQVVLPAQSRILRVGSALRRIGNYWRDYKITFHNSKYSYLAKKVALESALPNNEWRYFEFLNEEFNISAQNRTDINRVAIRASLPASGSSLFIDLDYLIIEYEQTDPLRVDFEYTVTDPATNTVDFTHIFENFHQNTTGDHLWEFGDGTTSTEADPTHAFSSTFYGRVWVKYTFTLEDGEEISASRWIKISDPLQVNFTASIIDPIDREVAFTHIVNPANTPGTHSWAFSDGGSSTSADPSHEFTSTRAGFVGAEYRFTASNGEYATVSKWFYISENNACETDTSDLCSPPTSCSIGSSLDPNGVVIDQGPSLRLQSPLGTLAFETTYRNKPYLETSLGKKWWHNHAIRLEPGATSDELLAYMSDGGQAKFYRDGVSDTFLAGLGAAAEIDASGSGDASYKLLTASKETYEFDADMRLQRHTWPNNEQLIYSYYSDDVSEPAYRRGKLQSVSNDYGKSLTFTYKDAGSQVDDGHLIAVTDSAGRQLQFAYSETQLDGSGTGSAILSSVTDVRGEDWTYAYYGEQIGEDDPVQESWLLRSTSPDLRDESGTPISNSAITLKAWDFTLDTGVVTAIEQQRGITNSTPLQTVQFDLKPNGDNGIQETLGGRSRFHQFNSNVYVGSEDGLGNASGQFPDESVNLRPSVIGDARGNVTELNWSSDGKKLNSVTDALSQTTGFNYDGQGRLTESTDAQGHTTEYTYGDSNVPRQPTVIRVLDGSTILRRQEFVYDSKGQVTSEKFIDPSDETTLLQETTRIYGTSGNSNGLLESLIVKDLVDPSNDVSTSYTYDAVGRVIKTQKSSMFGSCDVSFTVYDDAGNVVASICNYDPGTSGDPTTAAGAAGLYSATYPDKNHVTTHAYDSLGRRIATTINAGMGSSLERTSRTVYDGLGRVIRSIDNYLAQGSSTPADWEWSTATVPQGRWEDGSGSAIQHETDLTKNIISDVAYNARGLVRMRRDVLGNVSLFGYDEANRLVKSVQSAATPDYDNDVTGDIDLSEYEEDSSSADIDIITWQAYDANGNLIKTADARGQVTLTGLDALNRAVRVIRNASSPGYNIAADPELASYTFSTDPDKDQVSTTDYDSLGRVVRTQTLLENRDSEIWDTTLYGYDSLGRQIKTIQHASNPSFDTASYPDLAGYSVSTSPDLDHVTETVYDAQGRVLYTLDVDGNKNWQVYDGLNRSIKSIQNTSYVSGSPAPEDASYLGALTEADQDIISQTVFDSDGRVQRVQRALQTNGAETDLDWLYTLYGYDSLGRQVKTVQNASDPDYLETTTDDDLSNYTASSNTDEDIISQTVFDEQGRVLKTIDTHGNVTLYGYDSIGRRIKTIQNASNASYNDSGDYPTLAGYTPAMDAEIDQDRITQTVYDLAGRVAQTIDAANRVTVKVYDRLGRVIRSIQNYAVQGSSDPIDWLWSHGRWENGSGNVIQHGTEYDENIISETIYNKAGQVISSRDARGTVTSFAYDAAGRRRKVMRAVGTDLMTTSYTCFDKAGRVLRTIQNWIDDATSPDVWDMSADWVFAPTSHGAGNDENLITEFSYDQASRRISTTNPAGDTSLTTYFKNGQVETMTDPEGTVTLYRYDKLRRRTLVVQGYEVQGTSDPADWVWESGAWKQAPSGTVIQHGTNNDENIIVQIDYDKSGRMLSLRDPRGNVMTYEYDKLSRRTLLTNPLNQDWITDYVNDNQKTSVTMTYPGLSIGGTYDVQRDFDRLGRLTKIQYGDPANTPTVEFTYNAAGNRETMTESGTSGLVRQTQYGYDERNRLTQVGFDSDGDTVVEETVSYAYNLSGNRTTLTMPDGAGGTLSVTYSYDNLGRLVSLTDWDSQASTFDYDAVNRHIETTRPNGIDSTYEYDPVGRLTRLLYSDDVATHAEFAYVVDGRGNRVQANERLMKPDTSVVEQTIVYDYDGLSRLVSAQYHDGFNTPGGTVLDTYTYGYDRAGNLVNKNGVTRTYNAANQMTYDGTNTLTYDANGNLVSVGSETYGWDLANRMVATPSNTAYKYDGLGNRIQQTVDSVVTDYLNDVQPGLTQMIAATTDGDTERFVHGPRGIHAQHVAGSAGAIWGQAVWGQAVWGDTSSGTLGWQYLLQDGLGSVRSEANANADILANGGYDPYGLPIDLNGSFESPFGFTGEQTDANDQVYLRARYYTPEMGVFTALDPWEGIPQRPMSLNGYSWVEGNVPNAIDPRGLQGLAIQCQQVAAAFPGIIDDTICGAIGAVENADEIAQTIRGLYRQLRSASQSGWALSEFVGVADVLTPHIAGSPPSRIHVNTRNRDAFLDRLRCEYLNNGACGGTITIPIPDTGVEDAIPNVLSEDNAEDQEIVLTPDMALAIEEGDYADPDSYDCYTVLHEQEPPFYGVIPESILVSCLPPAENTLRAIRSDGIDPNFASSEADDQPFANSVGYLEAIGQSLQYREYTIAPIIPTPSSPRGPYRIVTVGATSRRSSQYTAMWYSLHYNLFKLILEYV